MNKPLPSRARLDIEAIAGQNGAASRWLQHRHARMALAAAGAALIAVVVWSVSGSRSAVRYVTDPVSRGNLIVVVTATGSVQPTNKVDVSSELSGTVRRVLADYNSAVTAGQALAELDTDKLSATVESSRARLAASHAKVADARATMVEKQRELARKQALASKDYSSVHDVEVAQAAHDRAVAGLASAQAEVGVAAAELKLNETNLSKACICSPINGVVLKRNVDRGQTVASSLQAPVLFSIAEDLRQMELQVDVDEADVGKVKTGQPATFGVDAFPDRKFPAAIKDVRYASETLQGVVTYKAILAIDNAELLLRPGMTATAEIKVTEVADALLIANAALRYTPPVATSTQRRGILRQILPGPPAFRQASRHGEAGANRTVWVLRDKTPVAVGIAVGPSDGQRTLVQVGDLKAGDAVVIEQLSVKP